MAWSGSLVPCQNHGSEQEVGNGDGLVPVARGSQRIPW